MQTRVISLLFALALLLSTSTAAAAGVTVGEQAPSFTLTDLDGSEVKLEDLAGSVVVLEWLNPDCPFVKRHYKQNTMKDLAAKYAGKQVKWLAINSTHYMSKEANQRFADQHQVEHQILIDKSGEVGKAYGAKTTPHMFIIDDKGVVVYQGAIDDDPYGNSDSAVNYVDAGLTQELKGEELSTTTTEPYGCSVKYAS